MSHTFKMKADNPRLEEIKAWVKDQIGGRAYFDDHNDEFGWSSSSDPKYYSITMSDIDAVIFKLYWHEEMISEEEIAQERSWASARRWLLMMTPAIKPSFPINVISNV